jgi:branched-chain amino acid transport system ATP-binding protein
VSASLSVQNLRAGYGGSAVLQDISFDVGPGEVVCLLGSNGAGKSTTMGVLTGLVVCQSGHIVYDGSDLIKLPSHERVKRGLVLSPEGRKVFPNLTVAENLMLGSYNPSARAGREQKFTEVYDLFPRLKERRQQKAGLMSGGEQQMLAIGRAVMANPRLLLLDEPSLGLSPKMVMTVFEAIGSLAKSANLSILLVEQNTQAALSVANRGYVMANGRIVYSGSADDLSDAAALREAFMGRVGQQASADEAEARNA